MGNIDTQSLSEVIAEFRNINEKDAITPETLGAILQRIADLLATAGTQETTETILSWYHTVSQMNNLLTSLVQGSADRNNIYLTATSANPTTGQEITNINGITIQQATTERAGAMRAQQVTDLNTIRTTVNSTILPSIETLNQQVTALAANGTATTTSAQRSRIAVEVVRGELFIYGSQQLLNEGYVPYLFRHTRRRNRRRDATENPTIKYNKPSKGWHLYGSMHSLRIVSNKVEFSTMEHKKIHEEASAYSSDGATLVKVHTREDGHRAVAWGRSMIRLYDNLAGSERMLRLPFALGFAEPLVPCRQKVNTLNLVSNLVEFSLIYNPITQRFVLSR